MTGINDVIKALQAMKMSGGAKKKKRRSSKKKSANPVGGIPAAMTLVPSSSSRKRRKRGRGSMGLTGEGTIRLRKRELLKSVTDVNGAVVVLRPLSSSKDSVMPFLGKLCNSFDRIVWHSLVIEWKPTVGTATDGSFSMGIDWGGGETVPTSKGDVLALTPNCDGAVYQPMVLRADQKRLMTKVSYNTTQTGQTEYPGTLKFWTGLTAAKAAGDIWVTYDVTLMGTQ